MSIIKIMGSDGNMAEIENYINGSKSSYSKNELPVEDPSTGEKIAREIMTTSRHQYSIAGFVDDNLEKHGALLHGKKIFCKIRELPNLKVHYDEILITAPSATGDQMRRIVEICKQTGKRYKTVPAINEIIDGENSLVWAEAENRLYAHQSILLWCLKKI